MPSTWLQNYPQDIRSDIPLNQYESLLHLFDTICDTYANNTAYVCEERELSFAQLREYSGYFSAYLQSKGIGKGHRVALMSANSLAFVVAMWGIIRSGAIQVNVNPFYSTRELAHQLKDADCTTLVASSAAMPVIMDAMTTLNLEHLVTITDDCFDKLDAQSVNAPMLATLKSHLSLPEALAQGKSAPYRAPIVNRGDLLFLQYTGGTTGLSKGACLSHGNLLANCAQNREMLKHYINDAEETMLTALPMYHIFALSVNILLYFSVGAKNILIPNPRDLRQLVSAWQQHSPSSFTGVNTLFNGLLFFKPFRQLDFSALKLTIGGGAAVQSKVAEDWESTTGTKLLEGYGLSETSPVLTINLGTPTGYLPGIGFPVPATDIRILDPQGNELPDGETGELCAKGPQVMSGYWNKPEETRKAFTTNGYFKTGDIAYLDAAGVFHIVDRKKDMILVSGFNVYPNEVEDVAALHQDVKEVACVGAEDAKSGEKVLLFVVPTTPDVQKIELLKHCKENLAAYKVPKEIIFLEQLPKSSVGKILRRELREIHASQPLCGE